MAQVFFKFLTYIAGAVIVCEMKQRTRKASYANEMLVKFCHRLYRVAKLRRNIRCAPYSGSNVIRMYVIGFRSSVWVAISRGVEQQQLRWRKRRRRRFQKEGRYRLSISGGATTKGIREHEERLTIRAHDRVRHQHRCLSHLSASCLRPPLSATLYASTCRCSSVAWDSPCCLRRRRRRHCHIHRCRSVVGASSLLP